MADKPIAVRVEVGGQWYSIGAIPLNPMMHLSRRLMGIPASGIAIDEKTKKATFSVKDVALAFSTMSNAQADQLFFDFLQTTRRDTGAGMQPIMSAPGVFTVADLQVADVYRLCYESYKFNLSDFVETLSSMMSLGKVGDTESPSA